MSERRRRGLWVGMLLALVAPSNSQGALRTLENIEELPLDRNKHLANHWLLIPFSCRERLGVPDSEAIPERELAFVVDSSPLGKMFFSSDSCETPAAIALERGTNRKHIQHHFERFEYPKPVDADNGLEMRRLRSNFQRWLQSRAIVEVGFINYLAQGSKVRVLWVEPGSDNEVLQGDVEYGEQSTWPSLSLSLCCLLCSSYFQWTRNRRRERLSNQASIPEHPPPPPPTFATFSISPRFFSYISSHRLFPSNCWRVSRRYPLA
jgi:hypothetical protein